MSPASRTAAAEPSLVRAIQGEAGRNVGTVPGPAASLWYCRKVLSSSRWPGCQTHPAALAFPASLALHTRSVGPRGGHKGRQGEGNCTQEVPHATVTVMVESASFMHLLCASHFISIIVLIILKADGNSDRDWLS